MSFVWICCKKRDQFILTINKKVKNYGKRRKVKKLKYCRHVQTSRIMKIIQFILLHKQKDDQVIHRKSILIGGNCIGMSFQSFSLSTRNVFDSLFYIFYSITDFFFQIISQDCGLFYVIFILYFRNFCKIRKKKMEFVCRKIW